MQKILSTEIPEKIKSNIKVIIAFVSIYTILCRTTLSILKSIDEKSDVSIYYVDVDEDKCVYKTFTIRMVPTIHLYINGEINQTLNLPFSKDDLLCLLK